jgi:hypothetical protein
MLEHAPRTLGTRGRVWLTEGDCDRLGHPQGLHGAVVDVGVCVHDDASPHPDVGDVGRRGRYVTARVRVQTDDAVTIPIDARDYLDVEYGDDLLLSVRVVAPPLSARLD